MIIGLVGFIGSGKNLAGDIIRDEMGFVPESFAKPVKDLTAELFGWDRLMLEGSTAESREWREKPDQFWSERFGKDFSPRLALQLFGTEVGRSVFHENLWVYSLEKRIKPNFNYVVTDVRFVNEIDFIHKMGGVVINIQRGKPPDWFYTAQEANTGTSGSKWIEALDKMENHYKIHPSEWKWIGGDIDYVVNNDSTPQQLATELKDIIRSQIEKGKHNETISGNTNGT